MKTTTTASHADASHYRAPLSERDAPSTSANSHAPTAPRRRPLRQALIALLLVAGIAWTARYAHRLFTHAETDNAFVAGHIHQVSSRIAGNVSEVLVEENSEVHAGDVLVRLDPRDAETKVVQAQALLALAVAKEKQAEAELNDSQAKVAQADAQMEKARLDFERARDLAQSKVASKQEFDTAKMSLDSSKAGADASRASANASESALVAAKAQLRAGEAYLEDAKLQRSYATITAPVSGRIGKRNAELGNRVQPGQALFAIVEPSIWIEANFKETQLAKMAAGQRAEITIDALPGREFTGTIESFSPASGAEFALLPPDNATGNFTKVVQRVPVRIQLDPNSIHGVEDRLRPGLSAVVAVKLE